jgi:hypothetical protein
MKEVTFSVALEQVEHLLVIFRHENESSICYYPPRDSGGEVSHYDISKTYKIDRKYTTKTRFYRLTDKEVERMILPRII